MSDEDSTPRALNMPCFRNLGSRVRTKIALQSTAKEKYYRRHYSVSAFNKVGVYLPISCGKFCEG